MSYMFLNTLIIDEPLCSAILVFHQWLSRFEAKCELNLQDLIPNLIMIILTFTKLVKGLRLCYVLQ